MYRVVVLFFITIYVECKKQDLVYMSTPELITYWGYTVENHTVKTEDNYLLTLHRIPNARSKHYPVLVQHGILLASDSWVLRGPGQDLADQGFDIWLANTRGTHYSRNHSSYKHFQKTFWNFGWNELGKFDIPAMINYVKKKTKRDKVIHLGHSMGTTSFYAMLSKKPEMNDEIFAHISLAPVAYMSRMRCLEVLQPLTSVIKELMELQDVLKLYNLFSRNIHLSRLLLKICNLSARNKYLCYRIIFYFVGFDFIQLKGEHFDRFLGHFPSGASAGMFLHFVQNILSKEFREFDYGRTLNIERYGKPIPPHYNLTKVTVPVYLYYSTNDFLSHNLDVEQLAKKLPNVKKKYLVPYKYFNHLDYLFAKDSKKLLFTDIVETMKHLPSDL